MTELELGWLAGLIEGEGSFIVQRTTRHHKTKTYIYLYPKISVHSTCEDIIQHLYELVGGMMRGPYCHKKVGHNPYWVWEAFNKLAYELMPKLYPLMGIKRKSQIDAVLNTLTVHPHRIG